MKILFFASIAEITGVNEIYLHEVTSSEELRKQLISKYPALEGLNFSFAINRTIVQQHVPLKDSDEVACLPPFSGG